MALYTNIYPSLKAADANNAAAIVAAASQAFGWNADGIARFCALISADPAEVASIVAQSRNARDAGAPWFVQP